MGPGLPSPCPFLVVAGLAMKCLVRLDPPQSVYLASSFFGVHGFSLARLDLVPGGCP